jgi:hypothetical protein
MGNGTNKFGQFAILSLPLLDDLNEKLKVVNQELVQAMSHQHHSHINSNNNSSSNSSTTTQQKLLNSTASAVMASTLNSNISTNNSQVWKGRKTTVLLLPLPFHLQIQWVGAYRLEKTLGKGQTGEHLNTTKTYYCIEFV